jgi:hypothetical protein
MATPRAIRADGLYHGIGLNTAQYKAQYKESNLESGNDRLAGTPVYQPFGRQSEMDATVREYTLGWTRERQSRPSQPVGAGMVANDE